MKHFNFLFLALVVCSTYTSTTLLAQDSPVDFLNAIGEEQIKVTAKNLEYLSYSVHSEDFVAIENKRREVLNQIKSSKNVVKNMTAPAKGDELKEDALEVLEIYDRIFNLDIVEVNKLKQSSKESYKAMEDYFKAQDKAEKELDRASDRFRRAQERFCKRNDINLVESDEEDPLSDQIKKMNQVNEYTRQIFLIYFKADKAHAIFMEALSNEDRGLESKRRKMEAAADEAIQKLKQIDGFDGDTDYRDRVMDVLVFYKEMAANEFATVVRVSKTKQEKLTQKDVDDFNDAIQQYNDNINIKVGKSSDARRALLQKHTPNVGVKDGKVRRT